MTLNWVTAVIALVFLIGIIKLLFMFNLLKKPDFTRRGPVMEWNVEWTSANLVLMAHDQANRQLSPVDTGYARHVQNQGGMEKTESAHYHLKYKGVAWIMKYRKYEQYDQQGQRITDDESVPIGTLVFDENFHLIGIEEPWMYGINYP